jgi:hypothetical protein
MKLSPPRTLTWWIALIAGSVSILHHYHIVRLPVIGPYAGFLLIGAWALLILATVLKGL